ncbi:hypothetical protein CEXT_211531 [Caerostris extrusa]|uniref:Uncharacterized protein n=1 Tax=Caerostris extrusa TaxID=172846 RepID=A0AAV4QB04_CAEEX|nr:hypothetical protein CEXT_211531 [Caerostris extrusa]
MTSAFMFAGCTNVYPLKILIDSSRFYQACPLLRTDLLLSASSPLKPTLKSGWIRPVSQYQKGPHLLSCSSAARAMGASPGNDPLPSDDEQSVRTMPDGRMRTHSLSRSGDSGETVECRLKRTPTPLGSHAGRALGFWVFLERILYVS